MNILEFLNNSDGNTKNVLEVLIDGLSAPLSDTEQNKKEWNVTTHDIFNKSLYPDKIVNRDGNKIVQKINRIAIPFQKTIVNRAVAFMFGNEVNFFAETTESEKALELLLTVNKKTKIDTHNRKMFKGLLRNSEIAELWYTEQHPTGTKIKCKILDPFAGDFLFPQFDEYGDMIAFGRMYVAKEDGRNKEIIDVYTNEEIVRYSNVKGGWVEFERVINALGKIPIIYTSIENTDWHDVQGSINRLEALLSRFAETNDYFSAPTLFIQGNIKNLPEKGESGKVLQGVDGSDAKIISWDNAPESVRLEIDTLIRIIYTFTQTPDISFDSVKGIGSISGVALQMLFSDAHLKVMRLKEQIDEYIERRTNVQLAILNKTNNLNTNNVLIGFEITPFMINDRTTLINDLATALGSGIISLNTAVKTLAWVDDADEEIKRIREDYRATQSQDLFPSID